MASKTRRSTATDGQATRWLNRRERETWLAFIFATRLFWEEVERDLQRDAQLPFGYYEILVMLSNAHDRTLRMSELAAATQSSRSRLSHAVARLEAEGWVRRAGRPTPPPRAPPPPPHAGVPPPRPPPPAPPETSRQHPFSPPP